MNQFEPVAIVGCGCVVPGAHDPGALSRLVFERRSALTAAPPGFGGLEARVQARARAESASLVGGYVGDVDLGGVLADLAIPEEALLATDISFQWAMAAARQALTSIGHDPHRPHSRAGLVLGNLSYPTRALGRFARAIWEADARGDPGWSGSHPRARFMSGLPAHLLAQALGFSGPAFSVDAACASSLYAVKLACDRLHDRDCDLMLAGGLNGTDDLFLHAGFTALGALSPTGQSRPFHRDADGLVPAQGAAFVALERLAAARAAGHRVLGVIRAVSVANDGRSQGLLVPSRDGQRRTMAAAYPASGLRPADISLVECHATGTRRGDETEVLALHDLLLGVDRSVAIGSLKGNLGHLVTASGTASIIKILGGFERGMLPPTLHADAPIDALASGPLRTVDQPEPWTMRPRRAAISNFGFGGNNAHLILEEPDADAVSVAGPVTISRPRPGPSDPDDSEVAVVAVGAIVRGAADFEGFARIVLGSVDPESHRVDAIHLDPAAVRFPPNDLREALPQQLVALAAAMQISDAVAGEDRARTGVLIGMQCDADSARLCGRLRTTGDPDGYCPPLSAALVVGTMPNVVANRIGSQFDVTGPGCTVSAEEASGPVAVELAMRAIDAGEIDAAIVGAVDLCCEPVQEAAACEAFGADADPPGDAAVVMLLKRLSDARRDGNRVHAVISRRPPADVGLSFGNVAGTTSLARRFGHAHAASGMVHLAAAIACCERRLRPGSPARPWLPNRSVWGARVATKALSGQSVELFVRADATTVAVPAPAQAPPRLEVYSATSRDELVSRLSTGDPDDGRAGSVRIAIVSSRADEPDRVRARAVEALTRASAAEGVQTLAEGIYFAERPLEGDVAFVFTGPAGAYAGMGSDLVRAFPELVNGVQEQYPDLREAAGWVYDPPISGEVPVEDKVLGSSYLSLVHAELTRRRLGLEPDAVIGLCSGESNALFAMGVWNDPSVMAAEIRAAGVFTRELAGDFAAVARSRGVDGGWNVWRLLAPVDVVRRALGSEPAVHLAIVQADDDVMICGDPAGCSRVVSVVGETRARRLGYDVAIHCPETRSFEAAWRALHDRPVRPHATARFYSHASCSAYALTRDSVADALTAQAMQTVDFPQLVRRAASDGVRIFIEHGQHAGCSKWIDKILDGTPHLAVPLDSYGTSSLDQVTHTVARLVVAGVPVNVGAIQRVLQDPPQRQRGGAVLSVPAHWPPVRTGSHAAAIDADAELMVAAPARVWAVAASVDAPSGDRAATATSVAQGLIASMTAEHRRFLEIIGAAHAQFITTQSSASDVLVRARSGVLARATASVRAAVPPRAAASRSLRLNRAQLEAHASGRVSDAFGPEFSDHDDLVRRVRMPEPPLLLVDRVTDMAAEPGSLGLGTVWTETDVTGDAWYLHEGRMPAGILIEAGQADLLLISYLGIDRLNRGERVYRLLGCDITFHRRLPRPGETVSYEIHVDGHAEHDGIRLFFFHYDGRVAGERQVSVRNAQAGFFTTEELENARGIAWRPETALPTPAGRHDPPAVLSTRTSFDRAAVRAFAEGRLDDCFGPAFLRARTHTRTPRIPSDRMQLVDEVTAFDPSGGPWGRGYLRAVTHLDPQRWFFRGHFTNDPCMPGTLMVETCLQAMAFYLAALGYTIARDAWVFEPTLEETMHLICRGQALPESSTLVCEVFVDEVFDGPEPTLYAAVLGTVDGQPSMHSPRLALSLKPGWPIDDERMHAPVESDRPDVATEIDGFEYGPRSIAHTALGPPAEAYGGPYRQLPATTFVGHLPAPPFQFMSRVVRIDGRPGVAEPGTTTVVEYDAPADSWYFGASRTGAMPFAVLLEAALQPCGWLAFFTGLPLTQNEPLYFRNLEGRGIVRRGVRPHDGTLRTEARLTSVSAAAGAVLASFQVSVTHGPDPIFDLETSFGFFDAGALERQAGLPSTAASAEAMAAPSDYHVAIAPLPAAAAGLPNLRLFDDITGLWPEGGAAGKGSARARHRIDPGAWYFKAHFLRDPVQPGSLGLQALLDLLEHVAIQGRGESRPPGARGVEAPALGEPFSWKYRGQILPESRESTSCIDVTRVDAEARTSLVVGEGSLWVDGTRIYEASGLSTRILLS
jgi:acyl transferase domain-containing protein/3-hydroxymyristoyl/3-hydroxydecanoyl-(acyl carrier protein) dehydratase